MVGGLIFGQVSVVVFDFGDRQNLKSKQYQRQMFVQSVGSV